MNCNPVPTFSRCLAVVVTAGLFLAGTTPAQSGAGTNKRLTLDDIFPVDRVVDVRITVDKDDWNTIRRQSRNFFSALGAARQDAPPKRPYTYVRADVIVDGVTFRDVGLRKKGFLGSQSSTRPSLKIKLNYDDKKRDIDGLTHLTLNNNRQDRSLVSQVMGYAFFHAVGLPAPRCALAQVTVNGKNLGVYSHVEAAKAPLLKREFDTTKGTLFEGTVVDFFDGWSNAFEHKSGPEKPGRKRIEELIDILEGKDGKAIVSSKSTMRVFVPDDDTLGNKWTAVDFDDSNWRAGKSGAGFDREATYESMIDARLDVGRAMDGRRSSLYVRIPFDVADPRELAETGRLLLIMKYDDGFVAYLNGRRIASANAPDSPHWDSTATGPHDDGAALRDEALDVSDHAKDLRRGRNVLAIHGLNIDVESSDMLVAAQLETNEALGEDAIGEIVDLDSFYKFWAVESLLGFWDGYSGNKNNFFVYRHPKTNKFHFMPWGADSLFVKVAPDRRNANTPLSVKLSGRLAYTLYQTAAGRTRYEKTLRGLLENHWDEKSLLAEMDRLEKLATPHLASRQRRVARALDERRKFVRNRRDDLLDEIEDGMPSWTRAPEPPFVVNVGGRGRRREGRQEERRNRIRSEADASDKTPTSTVFDAARLGDVADLRRHLARGTDVNAKDENGTPALSIAALAGRAEAVRYLLRKGADVDARGEDQGTALHAAAFMGHVETLRALLESKPRLDLINRDGSTALDASAAEWTEEIEGFVGFIGMILQMSFDEDEVIAGRAKVTTILIEKGAKRGTEVVGSVTAKEIWGAAKNGDVATVRKLLAKGTDANAKDVAGISPMSWATMAGRAEVVDVLLEHGADVDVRNQDNSAPLHSAAFFGHVEIVERLLDGKATINSRNDKGETPLDTVAEPWTPELQWIANYIVGALKLKDIVDVDDMKASRPKIAALLRKRGGKRSRDLE